MGTKNLAVIFLIFLSVISISETNWDELINGNSEIKSIESRIIKDDLIELTGVVVGDIRLEKLRTDLNAKSSSAEITLDDLRKSFLKSKEIQEVKISIKNSELEMIGKARFLGLNLNIELVGSFDLNDNNEILFITKTAKLGRFIYVPKPIIDAFHNEVNPIFKLDKIQIPLFLSKIEYLSDRIIFR